MNIDFAGELNPEQLAAVQAGDGPVLVIAAAGTGKTRTLIFRVAWLAHQGIEADRMLLLTFTNKAAREMMERGRLIVGGSLSGMWGGTFHHLANRLLRMHAPLLGYKSNYVILDSDDARTILRNATADLGLKDKNFPKPEVLQSMFSYAVNADKPVRGVVEDRFENHPVSADDILRVHAAYEMRKKALDAMDFDDLLVNSLRLMEEQPGVAARYQEQFRHVLVDEYQDTNPIQARLVDRLAAHHKNLLVVGDDFQSIYSWRGADFRNILEFPNKYPGAQVYKLETNYRSAPEILAVANGCIAGNKLQFQKTLRAVRPEHRKPVVAEMRAGEEQSRFILEQVQMLHRAGVPLREMAVLYRSHFHSMELQIEMTRQRIPHVITSGVRFFEQAHVKDVVSLARIVHSPTDELSFLRLLALLPKVGERTARKLWNTLDGRFNTDDPSARMKLLGAMPTGAAAAWAPVDQVFELAAKEHLRNNPSELMNLFLDKFYDKVAAETFDNYSQRSEDLQELLSYARQFATLEEFLNELALVSNLEAEDHAAEAVNTDAIRLSTIHQAKGLEWKAVFVLWLADGMFPSSRAMDESGGEDEERRLFYVATTRARDELYLCAPQLRRSRDGGVVYYSKSRFLAELDPALLRKQVVRSGFF